MKQINKIKKINAAKAWIIAAFIVIIATSCLVNPTKGQAAGPNDYFNSLLQRPDLYKQYSLRDSAQLSTYGSGGGKDYVTYDPTHDTDPHKQDAAKVVIPAFAEVAATTLSASANATDTTLHLVAMDSNYLTNRALKIDSEMMLVTAADKTNLTVTVTRAQIGTSAASHNSGAAVYRNINSLQKQIRLPVGTSDGNTYLFTWDAYWTDSYLHSGLTNHKTFQLTSGGESIWFETQTRYDGSFGTGFNSSTDVGNVTVRSYLPTGGNADYSLTPGYLGPGITTNDPVQPKQGQFTIKPNTWVRYWIRIKQVANDYDVVDYWVADENNNPVLVYSNLLVSVRDTGTPPDNIYNFWLEFNTSTDRFVRGTARDLVNYVRNFVVLKNPPSDISSLLVKPLGSSGGTTPPPPPPNPPPALTGDLNNDCVVNSLDWSVMNSKWFSTDPTADLNHDGAVNSLDWSLMNSNWFKTC